MILFDARQSYWIPSFGCEELKEYPYYRGPLFRNHMHLPDFIKSFGLGYSDWDEGIKCGDLV